MASRWQAIAVLHGDGPLEGGAGRSHGAMDVALVFDANLLEAVAVLVLGLGRTTLGPVRFWLVTRAVDAADVSRMPWAPGHAVNWLAVDDLDHGPLEGLIAHTSASAIDRLLLPAVLPELDKVLYLDSDILIRDDIRGLFDTDLADAPLAARVPLPAVGRGYQMNVLAGLSKLGARSEDFFAWATASAPLGFSSFNAGVMVLNLARMRADGFVSRFLPAASAFRLHDQQILNFYASNRIVPLDARFNYIPHQDIPLDPTIVHWAGAFKPWGQVPVEYAEEWRALHSQVT